MYRIVVNGEDLTVENPCKTWGELLDWLDARCGGLGQVVTEARLDGVECPAFRGTEFLDRRLEELAVIEIETADPRDLLVSTIEQAIQAAATLGAEAERIGGAFRGMDVSTANRDLAEFAGTLATLVSVTHTIAGAMNLGLSDVVVGDTTGARLVEELTSQADAVIAAQRQQDWITVADIVEYDIAPALGKWPMLFRAVAMRIPPAAA